MTPETEAELRRLMVASQDGDRAAYQALLERLVVEARRLARRRLPEDRVDDGVQNVLLAVHRARHTYDPGRPFRPWFSALARNRVTDTWRRVHRTRTRETGREDLQHFAGDSPSLEAQQDRAVLRAAIAQLPPRQRRVVELQKLEQRSVREVAALMDMSESAVKVTTHRATKALRRILGGRDD